MRTFKSVCILYCILYIIMTFIATWDIERSMTINYQTWKLSRKHWDPGFPTFHVQADATLIPFIIKVKHGSSVARLAGASYTSYCLWFFGFKVLLSQKITTIS